REAVCWRQPRHAGEERLVALVQVSLLEVIAHGTRVGAGLSQHPRLACEREPSAVEPIVEWLDAEPVARCEERASSAVPDDECPHAVEPLDAAFAPLAVRGEDHLTV